MTKETQEWLDGLKKEGNLSDEAFNHIKGSVEGNAKADEFVKGSVLRQNDYSRNFGELQKAKQDLELAQAGLTQKEVDLTKFQTSLGTWKSQAEGSFNDALKAREAAEKRANAAAVRLQTVAAKYGIAAEEVSLEGVEVKMPVAKVAEGVGMTQEDVDRMIQERVGKGTQAAAQFDALIQDISDQYSELYGGRWPVGTASKLLQEAVAAGKPLSEYASTKFKFEEKQKERDQNLFDAKVKEKVDAGVAAALSAAGLPGANPGYRDDLQSLRSPVLRPGGIPAPPLEGGGGVSAAVAAFQGAKYRQTR